MNQKKIDDVLNESRLEIDKIDEELVTLLWKRLKLVKNIWEIKKKHEIPILQKDRFKQIVDRLKISAEKHWLSPLFIEDIWEIIHLESLRNE